MPGKGMLDAFSFPMGAGYSKFSIFRKPQECGTGSDHAISLMSKPEFWLDLGFLYNQ